MANTQILLALSREHGGSNNSSSSDSSSSSGSSGSSGSSSDGGPILPARPVTRSQASASGPPAVRKRVRNIPPTYTVRDWPTLVRLATYAETKKYLYKMSPKIAEMAPVLRDIDQLVGMEEFKQTLFTIIMDHMVRTSLKKDGDMPPVRNMSIMGPTGSGKTTAVKHLAAIYSIMGVTDSSEPIFATRADLIGGYVGQTAIATTKLFKSAVEERKVIFIDEVYAIDGKKDVFAAECIATMLPFLSEDNGLVCVVAGYEKETNDFFRSNEGLRGRFPYNVVLKSYDHEQLASIFAVKVSQAGMVPSGPIGEPEWFKSRKDRFLTNGRSVDALIGKLKVAYNVRIFQTGREVPLEQQDLDAAYVEHCKSNPVDNKNGPPPSMYM